MTTDSREEPNERDDSQRKERGGAADVDRSKGLGTEESDTPFGRQGDGAETNKKSRDE